MRRLYTILLSQTAGYAADSLRENLGCSREQVALPALEAVRLVLTVGTDAAAAMRSFCQRTGNATPQIDARPLEPGDALLWDRRSAAVQRVRTIIGIEADESLSAS